MVASSEVKMELREGEVLESKFRITRLLSKGGMGAVYLGENTRIRRQVAIKVLQNGIATDEALQRFEKEAQAAGQIGSDHICEVLDLGTTSAGDRFMVMEFLDGETLKTRIRRGALSPIDAIPLVHQVLEGLTAAHAAGIVHRDLKPENVFILKEKAGRRDFVKILDFGISKFAATDGEEGMMTRANVVMGTPFYMSPEQARTSREVDNRSDLYSVGVMLYQTVTGKVPFNAPTFAQLLYIIAHEVPPHPKLLAPELDDEFCDIILKAMARDPDDRYQTARELQDALAAWRQDPAGVSRTVKRVEPARPAISFASNRDEHTQLLPESGMVGTPPPASTPGAASQPWGPGAMSASGTGNTQASWNQGGPPPPARSRLLVVFGASLGASLVVGVTLVLFLSRRAPAPTVGDARDAPIASATSSAAAPVVSPAASASASPSALASAPATPGSEGSASGPKPPATSAAASGGGARTRPTSAVKPNTSKTPGPRPGSTVSDFGY